MQIKKGSASSLKCNSAPTTTPKNTVVPQPVKTQACWLFAVGMLPGRVKKKRKKLNSERHSRESQRSLPPQQSEEPPSRLPSNSSVFSGAYHQNSGDDWWWWLRRGGRKSWAENVLKKEIKRKRRIIHERGENSRSEGGGVLLREAVRLSDGAFFVGKQNKKNPCSSGGTPPPPLKNLQLTERSYWNQFTEAALQWECREACGGEGGITHFTVLSMNVEFSRSCDTTSFFCICNEIFEEALLSVHFTFSRSWCGIRTMITVLSPQ